MDYSDQMWFRPEVLALQAYVPGKKGSRPDVIKLASNETPFPTLPQVQAAIMSHLGSLNRYPDMAATTLISDIAAFCEWPDDAIVVGNGSTALIEKILQAVVVPGGEVILPWRSFEAYPIAVQSAGGIGVKVPLMRDGGHDLRTMAKAIGPRTRAILLCSPNNPTGVALTHAEVADFLSKVPPTIPVLLDEAYIDFVSMPDPIRTRALLQEYPNLIALRTFSKAYGLAGVRCGYALTSAPMAAGLRAISTPFGVNALAQAAASAALRSLVLVRQQVGVIQSEREKFLAALHVQGWEVPASQANFVWLELGDDCVRFEELCDEEGVTVRRFGTEGVRVTIGEPEGSLRTLRALERLRER